jgi:hypothetical protein
VSHGSLFVWQPITVFQAIQLGLIAGGLAFTAVQLFRTARSIRVANLLALTNSHRELWTMLLAEERLRSVMYTARECNSPDDLSLEERILINFFLLHMASAHELQRTHMITRNRATADDMVELLSIPAFAVMWKENQRFHRPRFRRFIDRARRRRANNRPETAPSATPQESVRVEGVPWPDGIVSEGQIT